MNENLEIGARIIVLLFSLAAIIFGFGVVWRVEKKLDLAFKFFLGAVIVFFAGEISKFFYVSPNSFLVWMEPAAKIVFAFLFLAGILEMRSAIRHIDGEK